MNELDEGSEFVHFFGGLDGWVVAIGGGGNAHDFLEDSREVESICKAMLLGYLVDGVV
jgi:hypothetical protein